MKHFAFVDGQVIGAASWGEFSNLPIGTITYSPLDLFDPWCKLTGGKHGGGWVAITVLDAPPEFKVQLLLLGVSL